MKVTPVPIPNTKVKLQCADGTAGVTLWESRSSPGNVTVVAQQALLSLIFEGSNPFRAHLKILIVFGYNKSD